MRRRLLPATAILLALVAVAAACGGSASVNGSSGSAAASSHAGTTTVTGSAAGHGFHDQISSLANLLDQTSRFSGSAGSGRLAATISRVRRGLGGARAELAATTFPSVVQSEKQQLLQALDRWNGDLARAQQTARNGDTAQAIRQAKSSTYRDLKGLVDAVTAAATL